MFAKVILIFRAQGIAGLMWAANSRLRGLLAKRAKAFPLAEGLIFAKTGIEIGGPSPVFAKRGMLPIYPLVNHLDNCNFGITTVWEGNIKQGQTFQFDRKKLPGRQYIAEATRMECIPSGTYDFVLSSHVLEHTTNPILALSEWMRLLKDQGTLVLILPHKVKTFDHRRPVTTMEHLIDDFKAGITEDDLTHLPEILALHDLARDPEAGTFAAFKARSMCNFENRCLHHHVFDVQLAVDIIKHVGMNVLSAEEVNPNHMLLLARKIPPL